MVWENPFNPLFNKLDTNIILITALIQYFVN